MREIKFRAWYGDRLGMMNPQFNGDINEIFAERNGIYMQYTGLKDKNGTEIYEGDIFALEVPYIDFETGDTIYEKEYIPVTFEDGKYVLYEQGIRNHDLYDVLTGWRIREEYRCSGEVIGNIYENPELLKGEDR